MDAPTVFGAASCVMILYRIVDGLSTKKEAKEERAEQKAVTDQIAEELADHREKTSEQLTKISEDVSEVVTQTKLTNGSVLGLKETAADHESRIRSIEKRRNAPKSTKR